MTANWDNADAAEIRRWIARAGTAPDGARAHLSKLLWPAAVRCVSAEMGQRVRRWVEPEAIANQVLEEVLRKLPELPDGADESELLRRLRRTARSRVIDHVRSHKHDLGESFNGHDTPAPQEAEEPSMGPVTQRDLFQWVQGFIDVLPAEHGEVIRLHLIEGRTFVQIGRDLDISADAARMRFMRALKALGRVMPDEHWQ